MVEHIHIPNIDDYTHKVKELTKDDHFLSWIDVSDIYRPLSKTSSASSILQSYSDYIRIAISGGPSSGKTTVLQPLNALYSNVYVFPEIATQLISYLKNKYQLLPEDTSWALQLFGNKHTATKFEYLTLMIRMMQKEYADMIWTWFFVSDRAVVEWYHFMDISNVDITPQVIQDIHRVKEDIVFLFSRRKNWYAHNGTRYEWQDFAIRQQQAFEIIIPDQGWYVEWENYFIVTTYLDEDVEVEEVHYRQASTKRLDHIKDIIAWL